MYYGIKTVKGLNGELVWRSDGKLNIGLDLRKFQKNYIIPPFVYLNTQENAQIHKRNTQTHNHLRTNT